MKRDLCDDDMTKVFFYSVSLVVRLTQKKKNRWDKHNRIRPSSSDFFKKNLDLIDT